MKRIEGLVDSSSFEVDPVSLWQETISGKSLSIEIGFSEVQNWDLVKGKKESYFTRMRTKDSSRKSNSRGNSLEDLEVSYLHLTLATMKADICQSFSFSFSSSHQDCQMGNRFHLGVTESPSVRFCHFNKDPSL